MKAEFVLLAHTYDPLKISPAGWFMSTKLDGMRAVWDGGVSRGVPTSQVPWANTEKDSRYVSEPIATGLWSRYGNVIHAPAWFLDALPPYPLDGELYAGIGKFQDLMSTVKQLMPDERWRGVSYVVFDAPPATCLLTDREINTTNFKKVLSGCQDWHASRLTTQQLIDQPRKYSFEDAQAWLRVNLPVVGHLILHDQQQLPFSTDAAREELEIALQEVTAGGGEGIMLRKPMSIWMPQRSHDLLKVKKLRDAEAIVVGYTWGKLTDKGSKLLGKMGSLRCRLTNGKEFDLSGFTDEERMMSTIPGSGQILIGGQEVLAHIEGENHPGEPVANGYHNPTFPIGSKITFTYREMTTAGLPKEARYLRKR